MLCFGSVQPVMMDFLKGDTWFAFKYDPVAPASISEVVTF
jgi:hypothetical protein